MSCPVTVKLNVLSLILAPSGDVALIANVDVTFSLTSVGVPLTDVYARGTPSTVPLLVTCIPSGTLPAIKLYVGVPPSGSVARTGT